MLKGFKTPPQVSELQEPDDMHKALQNAARAYKYKDNPTFVAKKLFALAHAKKVVTSAFKGVITVEKTEHDDGPLQLDATKDIARLDNLYLKPQM